MKCQWKIYARDFVFRTKNNDNKGKNMWLIHFQMLNLKNVALNFKDIYQINRIVVQSQMPTLNVYKCSNWIENDFIPKDFSSFFFAFYNYSTNKFRW